MSKLQVTLSTGQHLCNMFEIVYSEHKILTFVYDYIYIPLVPLYVYISLSFVVMMYIIVIIVILVIVVVIVIIVILVIIVIIVTFVIIVIIVIITITHSDVYIYIDTMSAPLTFQVISNAIKAATDTPGEKVCTSVTQSGHIICWLRKQNHQTSEGATSSKLIYSRSASPIATKFQMLWVKIWCPFLHWKKAPSEHAKSLRSDRALCCIGMDL